MQWTFRPAEFGAPLDSRALGNRALQQRRAPGSAYLGSRAHRCSHAHFVRRPSRQLRLLRPSPRTARTSSVAHASSHARTRHPRPLAQPRTSPSPPGSRTLHPPPTPAATRTQQPRQPSSHVHPAGAHLPTLAHPRSRARHRRPAQPRTSSTPAATRTQQPRPPSSHVHPAGAHLDTRGCPGCRAHFVRHPPDNRTHLSVAHPSSYVHRAGAHQAAALPGSCAQSVRQPRTLRRPHPPAPMRSASGPIVAGQRSSRPTRPRPGTPQLGSDRPSPVRPPCDAGRHDRRS